LICCYGCCWLVGCCWLHVVGCCYVCFVVGYVYGCYVDVYVLLRLRYVYVGCYVWLLLRLFVVRLLRVCYVVGWLLVCLRLRCYVVGLVWLRLRLRLLRLVVYVLRFTFYGYVYVWLRLVTLLVGWLHTRCWLRLVGLILHGCYVGWLRLRLFALYVWFGYVYVWLRLFTRLRLLRLVGLLFTVTFTLVTFTLLLHTHVWLRCCWLRCTVGLVTFVTLRYVTFGWVGLRLGCCCYTLVAVGCYGYVYVCVCVTLLVVWLDFTLRLLVGYVYVCLVTFTVGYGCWLVTVTFTHTVAFVGWLFGYVTVTLRCVTVCGLRCYVVAVVYVWLRSPVGWFTLRYGCYGYVVVVARLRLHVYGWLLLRLLRLVVVDVCFDLVTFGCWLRCVWLRCYVCCGYVVGCLRLLRCTLGSLVGYTVGYVYTRLVGLRFTLLRLTRFTHIRLRLRLVWLRLVTLFAFGFVILRLRFGLRLLLRLVYGLRCLRCWVGCWLLLLVGYVRLVGYVWLLVGCGLRLRLRLVAVTFTFTLLLVTLRLRLHRFTVGWVGWFTVVTFTLLLLLHVGCLLRLFGYVYTFPVTVCLRLRYVGLFGLLRCPVGWVVWLICWLRLRCLLRCLVGYVYGCVYGYGWVGLALHGYGYTRLRLRFTTFALSFGWLRVGWLVVPGWLVAPFGYVYGYTFGLRYGYVWLLLVCLRWLRLLPLVTFTFTFGYVCVGCLVGYVLLVTFGCCCWLVTVVGWLLFPVGCVCVVFFLRLVLRFVVVTVVTVTVTVGWLLVTRLRCFTLLVVYGCYFVVVGCCWLRLVGLRLRTFTLLVVYTFVWLRCYGCYIRFTLLRYVYVGYGWLVVTFVVVVVVVGWLFVTRCYGLRLVYVYFTVVTVYVYGWFTTLGLRLLRLRLRFVVTVVALRLRLVTFTHVYGCCLVTFGCYVWLRLVGWVWFTFGLVDGLRLRSGWFTVTLVTVTHGCCCWVGWLLHTVVTVTLRWLVTRLRLRYTLVVTYVWFTFGLVGLLRLVYVVYVYV